MSIQFNLASAANTSNPALYVLQKRGYTLEVKVTRDELIFYIAMKDERRFVGNSAPEVLGLVAMWEELGDDWREKLTQIPDILADVIVEEEP